MCSVAVIVLLAFVTEAHTETSMPSLASSEAADVQEKLAGRVLKSGELRGAGFDLTTIGKRHATGRQAQEELELKHKADLEMAAKKSAPVQKQPTATQPKVEPTPTAKQSAAAQPKVEPEPTTKQSAAAQPKVEPTPTAKQSTPVQPKVEAKPMAKQSAAVQPKVELKSKPEAIAKQSTVMQPKIGVELVANVSVGVQPKAQKEQPKAAGVQYIAKQEPTALHTANVQHNTGLKLAESPSVNTEHKLKSDSAATYASAQHKVAFELAAQQAEGMQQVRDSSWTSCGGIIAAVMVFLLAGSGAIVVMRRLQRRRALTETDYVIMMAA